MTSSMPSGCRSFRHLRLFLLHAVPALPVEKVVESARRTGRYSDADRYPTADAAAVYYAAVRQRKAENWHTLSGYDKFNTPAWELISHLWFLLVLVVLTSLGVVLFKWLTRRPAGGRLSLW